MAAWVILLLFLGMAGCFLSGVLFCRAGMHYQKIEDKHGVYFLKTAGVMILFGFVMLLFAGKIQYGLVYNVGERAGLQQVYGRGVVIQDIVNDPAFYQAIEVVPVGNYMIAVLHPKDNKLKNFVFGMTMRSGKNYEAYQLEQPDLQLE